MAEIELNEHGVPQYPKGTQGAYWSPWLQSTE